MLLLLCLLPSFKCPPEYFPYTFTMEANTTNPDQTAALGTYKIADNNCLLGLKYIFFPEIQTCDLHMYT